MGKDVLIVKDFYIPPAHPGPELKDAWSVYETATSIHIVPRFDLDHWLDPYCPCMPEVEVLDIPAWAPQIKQTMVTHNSYDGRERHEGPKFDASSGIIEPWQEEKPKNRQQ